MNTAIALAREPVDVALDCSGRPAAMEAALAQLRPAGTLVLVGTGAPSLPNLSAARRTGARPVHAGTGGEVRLGGLALSGRGGRGARFKNRIYVGQTAEGATQNAKGHNTTASLHGTC